MQRLKLPLPKHIHLRSLRLRLQLWYGTLMTVTLGIFALLLLLLATNALQESVESTIRAEAHIAVPDVQDELISKPPYLPRQFVMNIVTTYHDPGVVVEILDAQGRIRFLSASGMSTPLPISADTTRAVLAGQSVWYTTSVGSEPVRVEALPISAPVTQQSSQTKSNTHANPVHANGTATSAAPIIGVLLVAKWLGDVNATLLLLRTLLLVTGLVTFVAILAGSWLIATQVLHPLRDIAATAGAIASATASGTRFDTLSQRVPRPGGRDELAQVVDTLNKMLASLQHATETQRRFVADASHELRAPLATVQGNLAFLRRHVDELPPEERHKILADAHEDTLRLTQLVEYLLLLARADAAIDRSSPAPKAMGEASGESSVQQEAPVELDHIVLQLIRQQRGRLSAEEAAPKLELGHIEPVRVRGDEERLRRVTLILLDNALKYTPPNTQEGPGRVMVSLECTEGQAALCVHDTGIGIDPADLPHIFERFYRADRARSRQGTGLGLSIAQTLVEQLGGHITAESTPGKGSRFTVWLPLA